MVMTEKHSLQLCAECLSTSLLYLQLLQAKVSQCQFGSSSVIFQDHIIVK